MSINPPVVELREDWELAFNVLRVRNFIMALYVKIKYKRDYRLGKKEFLYFSEIPYW